MHIALCDDHALVADGIAMLLRSLDPDVQVSSYHSAGGLLAAASHWSDVDLVLLDLGLPDSTGLQVLLELRSLRDDVPVVVLSGISDRAAVLSCIDAGAMGFIPKAASSQVMLHALRTVLDKGVFIPEAVLTHMPAGGRRDVQRPPQLTPRQRDVLLAVMQGRSIKRMARDLGISENTVKTHVSVVLRELDVTTRTEAVVKVVSMGPEFLSAHSLDR